MTVSHSSPLTPRQIVEELDLYIIGQEKAKRAVAIALRNRWRRQQLSDDLKDEVAPKNIIMIGPTGVGKTEIARRLARLAQSPFLKVEASKFTEVGYVGRDVETMVRDLVEIAVSMVKTEQSQKVQDRAQTLATERLLDLLLPPDSHPAFAVDESGVASADGPERYLATREKLRTQLAAGRLDNRTVEMEVPERSSPTVEIFSSMGLEEMGINFKDMLGGILPPKKKRRRVFVPEALQLLAQEEAQKLVDMDEVVKEAIARTEQAGIIFLDEIDKVASRETGAGPDVSREGVQRDLLPIVEGSTVHTKYGLVNTDHILFIAAGAFNVAKPSDLIPELQGRFPIRVTLSPLSSEDFVRILTEPKNALVRQYRALLATEGIDLDILPDAVEEIARTAAQVNSQTEDIGARRLHTVMEKLLEELSFDAPEMKKAKVVIDTAAVREKLADIASSEDLSRYIL